MTCTELTPANVRRTAQGRFLTLAATALLSSVTLLAQSHPGGGGGGMQPTPNQQTQQGTEGAQGSMQDQDFARKALAGGQIEIQFSQLALQKTQSDDVKQFAQKMVDDHTQIGTQLQPIAHQMGIEPPRKPSKKEQQELTKLQGLSGQDFDNEYITVMVKDHRQVLKDFKSEEGSTQDPNLKKFTTANEPVITGHLEAIEQVAKAHNVTVEGK